jgi:hypothetical protein
MKAHDAVKYELGFDEWKVVVATPCSKVITLFEINKLL